MKKEIANYILKNSKLLEVVEEGNDLVIYQLDLDAYDEDTESFYRVVDYKGLETVGRYLIDKCEDYSPKGLRSVEFNFNDFKVVLPCTLREIF